MWGLIRRQHGVVTRRQLIELEFTPRSIGRRIANGRLHPVRRGVYAVGRPDLTREGEWMAAVLSCGPESFLSHDCAGAHWGIVAHAVGPIHVSRRLDSSRRPDGVVVHRRPSLALDETTEHKGIPVTNPACTLIDMAASLDDRGVESAVNEADKLDLISPEQLRSVLGGVPRRPGLGRLREVLDRRTFTLTDSELERRFLRLIRRARLPEPQTGTSVNGFKVDFYWPDIGLIVETDGLRYHRTPSQQARDRLRDQSHAATGLTPIRFTHAQVRYEPVHVLATLSQVVRRLRG